MKDKTIIQIARTVCGTALLIAHAFTGINGNLVITGMVLMGVPFEYAKKEET